MRVIAPKTPRLPQARRKYLEQGQPNKRRCADEASACSRRFPRFLAMAKIHLDADRLEEAADEVGRELTIAPESAAARELKATIDAATLR
jgi:hypothetical protein